MGNNNIWNNAYAYTGKGVITRSMEKQKQNSIHTKEKLRQKGFEG